MRYAISALALALVVCLLSGCTYQQIAAFNSFVNGMNAGIAAAQRERALRAYEASIYNPQPQTVVVVHQEGR